MKSGLTLLFVLIALFPSIGSNDSIYVESSRNFDQYELEQFKANPDYSYIHASQKTHWLEEFIEWFTNKFGDWFVGMEPEALGNVIFNIIKILLWLILIAGVGMLAYSLYKFGVFGFIGRKKQTLDLSFSDLENKVIETDWQELISKAIMNKQYNVATRLLFLQLLQTLNHTNHIEWNKSKSIRDYQRELSAPYNLGFSALARYYQYSWFGDVVIDETHFNKMQEAFNSFKIELNVA